jgi:hypothetical protein
LQNKSVKLKPKELHAQYEKYCEDSGLHAEKKIEFTTGMEQFGFKYSMINGYNAYRITVDQLKTLAERRKWLHALDSDDIDENVTDDIDGDDDSDGVDLSDKFVDVSAAYTALLAKYNALLNQVSGIKKKGFGVLFRDEEDELYVHDNYDNDSDDEEEEEEIIVAKPAKKKNKDLFKKEIDDCLGTIDFL